MKHSTLLLALVMAMSGSAQAAADDDSRSFTRIRSALDRDAPRLLPVKDVEAAAPAPVRVRQKSTRRDPLWNGAVIGAAVGFAAGYATGAGLCGSPSNNAECWNNLGGGLVVLGLVGGAIVGAIMDKLR